MKRSNFGWVLHEGVQIEINKFAILVIPHDDSQYLLWNLRFDTSDKVESVFDGFEMQMVDGVGS